MCVNPLQIRVTSRTFGTSHFVDAPCGKCVECLKRRQNDWKLRIVHESQYWSKLYFFTLTYNNDSLPCRVDFRDIAYGIDDALFLGSYNECVEFVGNDDDLVVRSSACKVDVQKFLKRLRTNYLRSTGSVLEMKYFICAEYGPNPNGTKRPHYHGIIMTDADYFDLLPDFNAWSRDFGRMEFKQVGFGRDQASKVANYISKYCAKGCFESRIEDISNGFIERAWYIMSKNIGLRWLEQNSFQWLDKVPLSSEMSGEWSYEDVEKFFNVCPSFGDLGDKLPRFFSKDFKTHYNSNRKLVDKYAKEIDSLIDSFFVCDGSNSYSYKMPRYYRERLLCVKKTFLNSDILLKNGKPIPTLRICESQLQPVSSSGDGLQQGSHFAFSYLPEPITYESYIRKDTRYVSENFLSVAFAYRLSLRALNRFQDLYSSAKSRQPMAKDTEILLSLSRKQEMARVYREKMSTQRLLDFYNSNMWNHREFDYEFDEVLNYNIFN